MYSSENEALLWTVSTFLETFHSDLKRFQPDIHQLEPKLCNCSTDVTNFLKNLFYRIGQHLNGGDIELVHEQWGRSS